MRLAYIPGRGNVQVTDAEYAAIRLHRAECEAWAIERDQLKRNPIKGGTNENA